MVGGKSTIDKILIFTTLSSFCLLFVVLNITTPANAGPLGILAIFVLSYLTLIGISTALIYHVSAVFSKMSLAFMVRRPIEPISFRHSYYYSTVTALAPIMLVGLQSVGASSVYGVLLIILFVVIGCVYITKTIR